MVARVGNDRRDQCCRRACALCDSRRFARRRGHCLCRYGGRSVRPGGRHAWRPSGGVRGGGDSSRPRPLVLRIALCKNRIAQPGRALHAGVAATRRLLCRGRRHVVGRGAAGFRGAGDVEHAWPPGDGVSQRTPRDRPVTGASTAFDALRGPYTSAVRTSAVVLALVVTILGLGHIGANAAQQAPAPARSTLRVLRGIVTADGGAPLQRVRVLVSAASLSADPVFTNELGAFDVQVPAAASYTLTLRKPGFARQDLRRAADAPETALRIRLESGAAFNARVVYQFGDPDRRGVRLQGAGFELSGDTDDLGAFRFGGLPSGRYAVTVVSRPRPPGTGRGEPEPSVVDLAAGAET